MSKKKVFITQAWLSSAVPHMKDYVAKLESLGCEVEVYPKAVIMPADELKKHVRGVYAHICGTDGWTKDVMDAADSIKIIARIGVGYDSVDIPAATARNILVLTTPKEVIPPVVEYTITVMLAMSRRIVQNDKMVRTGEWVMKMGWSVFGKTLGIVGLGGIGKSVAKYARALDMKVIAYDPVEDAAYAKQNGITYMPMHQLLRESDFVTLHMPRMESTLGLIGEKELAMMKPTAQLINTARGGIVDEKALYNALKNKIIDSAAFDVFAKEPINRDNPLLELENMIFTPHSAGNSVEGMDAIVGRAVQNVVDVLEGKRPPEANIRNPLVFEKMKL